MARLNLKIFRMRQGLTQEQMAEKIGGYGRASYMAIENGKRAGKQVFWIRLQKAFGLSDAETWELTKKE